MRTAKAFSLKMLKGDNAGLTRLAASECRMTYVGYRSAAVLANVQILRRALQFAPAEPGHSEERCATLPPWPKQA